MVLLCYFCTWSGKNQDSTERYKLWQRLTGDTFGVLGLEGWRRVLLAVGSHVALYQEWYALQYLGQLLQGWVVMREGRAEPGDRVMDVIHPCLKQLLHVLSPSVSGGIFSQSTPRALFILICHCPSFWLLWALGLILLGGGGACTPASSGTLEIHHSAVLPLSSWARGGSVNWVAGGLPDTGSIPMLCLCSCSASSKAVAYFHPNLASWFSFSHHSPPPLYIPWVCKDPKAQRYCAPYKERCKHFKYLHISRIATEI